MFKFVKLSFEDNNSKEKVLFEEMCKNLKELEKKINKDNFNVYCVSRCDEGFVMGDYDLPKNVYGEIYVEGDDVYEESVMNRIEGTKNWVNYIF